MPEDVESIVGFEAQQNIPFPIEEVVWNHQIMGDRRDESWDVALVAIKTEQLTEVLDAATRGGLSARNVDVAPMALYNAFRFNYPEVEESSLLIDLGARTTNLIFSENGRAFSRSIPIGGHAISAAIAKEFEQDITLAEKLKIEKGLVGLGEGFTLHVAVEAVLGELGDHVLGARAAHFHLVEGLDGGQARDGAGAALAGAQGDLFLGRGDQPVIGGLQRGGLALAAHQNRPDRR